MSLWDKASQLIKTYEAELKENLKALVEGHRDQIQAALEQAWQEIVTAVETADKKFVDNLGIHAVIELPAEIHDTLSKITEVEHKLHDLWVEFENKAKAEGMELWLDVKTSYAKLRVSL